MQASPPLVVGIEVDGVGRAYDWNQLVKAQLVNDEANGEAVLAVTDKEARKESVCASCLETRPQKSRF